MESIDDQFSEKPLFTSLLLKWSERNTRQFPWKEGKDPYQIWVSEIILQQTRVDQGLPYYHRFINQFPTIFDLAKAEEDLLMQIWRGLGYYSRARNMQNTARLIVEKYDGKFPDERTELIKLKGIGPYTAAALLSFAFNQPYPVVDGNVIRVLSRISGVKIAFSSPEGRKLIEQKADHFLDKTSPGIYNQAIMDFGATWCTPQKPKCSDCFFKAYCEAYKNEIVHLLPVKIKKLPKKMRYFIFFLIFDEQGQLAIQKRNGEDIWRSLYELPNVELSDFEENNIQEATDAYFMSNNGHHIPTCHFLLQSSQLLTHQKINARFYQLDGFQSIQSVEYQFNFVNIKNLCNFAFPKIIEKFLKSINFIHC